MLPVRGTSLVAAGAGAAAGCAPPVPVVPVVPIVLDVDVVLGAAGGAGAGCGLDPLPVDCAPAVAVRRQAAAHPIRAMSDLGMVSCAPSRGPPRRRAS